VGSVERVLKIVFYSIKTCDDEEFV
jgi:hypothetical protein